MPKVIGYQLMLTKNKTNNLFKFNKNRNGSITGEYVLSQQKEKFDDNKNGFSMHQGF